MTAWFGTFALTLGFCSALASVGLWAWAAATGSPDPPARWPAVVSLLGAAGAIGAAEWALLSHDFSVRFVAENGSRATSAYYTFTSLWAAHDGSLLLWVFLLSCFVAVVALRRMPGLGDLHSWATTVLSAVAAFFFGLALFTGHVFERVSPAPSDGPGPNPLLTDHPAMGIHPPLLYTGLVGMAVPFAFAVGGLITGKLDRRWLAAVRGYAVVAWTALTAGIVMGAWWSYAVLGWGGYWAWDPVENSSLLPWLVATALLHSSMVQRRRQALPVWNLSLSVAAFLLACLGTFLTRSGVTASVHSFADSGVGPVLLGFLAALAAGVVALVLLRADRLGTPRPVGAPLSRGSAILANNVVLVALTVTVLFGTVFPLLAEWTTGQQLSVGPPYYNRMAVPICLVLLLLMALGPLVRWRGDDAGRLLRRMALPVVAGAAAVVVTALTAGGGTMTLLTFGLATLVVASVVVDVVGDVRQTRARAGAGWVRAVGTWWSPHRRRAAGLLVHVAVVLVAVGVAASSAYTSASERTLHPGEQAAFAGHHVRLEKVDRERTGGEMRTAARLRLDGAGGAGGAVIAPALRYFPGHDMTVATPVTVSGLGGDVYVTLLSAEESGKSATLRLAVNPLVGWIWAGGTVMVLGSILAAWPRRRRRRAPEEAAREKAPDAGPEPEPELALEGTGR
ncbi:heme lyase CcmF/NrfE family subunit [Actinopolymorpha singaporensis]|uniref:Cytochrome c-type biogenesis protein CcmF n=1 Tax=Actinopolymorpha singaporensis TaxID=117157 RepID=A0A1H1TK95_9ACTN|nr:cytochrome c-type biogenesis CcmF C-terminal domain-containing protein [Actinopolymorpha singaporensis]SDS60673.1 cytochrome c-type biogenesis protein CcmF [Actinopolymorpha singaporensis]